MKRNLHIITILFISNYLFAQCPEPIGAMINACGSQEGVNELVLFTTQTTNIGLNRVAASMGVNNNHNPELAKKNIKIMTSIIQSMTEKERSNKVNLNESRIRRIGKGSGYQPEVVKQIIESFEKTKTQILMLINIIKQGGNQQDIINVLKNVMSQLNK